MAETTSSSRAPRRDERRDRILAAARQAYTFLRADPSVDNCAITKVDVARVAGIHRQHLSNNTDPNWRALGEAIERHVSFDTTEEAEALASVAARQRSARQREIDALGDRVRRCEQAAVDIQRAADGFVLGPFLRELQHYMYLAKAQILPSEQGKTARLHQDLEDTRRENERLKARIRILTEGGMLEALIRAQTEQRCVDVVPPDTRGTLTVDRLIDLYDDSLAATARFAHNPDLHARPAVIYVLAGNIGAGKSRWIRGHQPDRAGLHLYLDAPHHTAAIRRALIQHARSCAPPCRVVCVWMRTTIDTCLDRNGGLARRSERLAVRGVVVRDLHDVFEPVGMDEGFDAIEIIRDDDGQS